jgi:two-component system, OmpR family, sensor histidine kinase TctE
LIDNACHYTQSDVTVRVTQDHLASHLYVLDNGPGIPIHEREQVFEPFYSVLGEHKGGSGLGLAIVKEIARMHDAELELTENIELQNAYLKPGLIVHVVFKRADVPLDVPQRLET